MLALFPAAARPAAPRPLRSLLVATLATLAALLALLSTLVRVIAAPRIASAPPSVEHVTWMAAPPPSGVMSATSAATVRAPATRGISSSLPRDTASGALPLPPGAGERASRSATRAPSLGTPSSRLMPDRGAAPWTPPVVFDPFRERAAPSPEVRDSLLRDLRDTIAPVARVRVGTGARYDSLIKEGMLRNRLSGRTLLDPQVGNGTYNGAGNGLPDGGFSVPFLEPGPSRARRVRDSISFAENRARLLRLRARADSLRASRPAPR